MMQVTACTSFSIATSTEGMPIPHLRLLFDHLVGAGKQRLGWVEPLCETHRFAADQKDGFRCAQPILRA
jgi:hypothetical protein